MIRKLLKRGFLLLGFLAIGLGLVAIMMPNSAPGKVLGTATETGKAIMDPVEAAFAQKDELYILLLGLDYNYDRKAQRYTKNARSDTILLVRVEPRGSHLSMLSVPRDLLVPIGRGGLHGYDKINAAFSAGGVNLTRETVEQLLGVKIDHHVIVKSDVVEKMVDDLGGVKVDVEMDMDYDDSWAGLHIHLKEGPQTLSGSQAIGYLRFRGGWDGDLGRIRRQQQFLQALLGQLKSREHWKDYPALAKTVADNMQTDLKVEQMVGLATLYKSFPMSSLRKGRVDVADHFENGIAYLIPLQDQLEATLADVFPELPPAALARLTLEVEDYRRVRKSRRQMKSLFREAGFGKVTFKRLRPDSPGSTEVVMMGDTPAARTALEKLLPGVPIKVKKSQEDPKVILRLFSSPDFI